MADPQDVPNLIKEIEVCFEKGDNKTKVDPEKIRQYVKDLGDENFETRVAAHKALEEEIGYQARSLLEEASKGDDAEIKQHANDILGKFKSSIEAKMAKKLLDPVESLGQKGPAAKDAVPVLRKTITLLGKDNDDLRNAIFSTFKKIGPGAEAAVPELMSVLKNSHTSEEKRHAITALGSIGKKEAAPALIDVLKSDNDPYVRWDAVVALENIKPKAETVMPALIDALKDQDYDVRRGAAVAVGKYGAAAKDAVPVLIVNLQDTSSSALQKTIQALASIGPEAKEAVEALNKLANDYTGGDANEIKQEARKAIEAIEKKPPEKIPFLPKDIKEVIPPAAYSPYYDASSSRALAANKMNAPTIPLDKILAMKKNSLSSS